MAKLIEWSAELSVGIDEIDEQHKVLVGLLNDLHEAIMQRHGNEVCRGILDRLLEYTRIHFTVEESLMRILHYPDYENHKHEHDELSRQATELVAKLDGKKHAISFELIHFLKLWLTKHIMESDKAYAPFFFEQGIKGHAAKKSWMTRLFGG
ncbi:MAG: hemerythrin family protein [Chromatiales bacterium]|nr:hemerythrin family protein [Chromatiales bacterium]